MTIYEMLFGTPEKAAKSLECLVLDSLDHCDLGEIIRDNGHLKCANCRFDFDRYGCEWNGTSVLDWLKSEVVG